MFKWGCIYELDFSYHSETITCLQQGTLNLINIKERFVMGCIKTRFKNVKVFSLCNDGDTVHLVSLRSNIAYWLWIRLYATNSADNFLYDVKELLIPLYCLFYCERNQWKPLLWFNLIVLDPRNSWSIRMFPKTLNKTWFTFQNDEFYCWKYTVKVICKLIINGDYINTNVKASVHVGLMHPVKLIRQLPRKLLHAISLNVDWLNSCVCLNIRVISFIIQTDFLQNLHYCERRHLKGLDNQKRVTREMSCPIICFSV